MAPSSASDTGTSAHVEEQHLVDAACEVLRTVHAGLKGKEIATRLCDTGLQVQKKDLSSMLYRALRTRAGLRVDTTTGVWTYTMTTSSLESVCTRKLEGLTFSQEQGNVISAAADAWLLVEAGPGTGKTAVACARVAKLLDEEVSPSSILIVSFTRTAVAELRERIRSLATRAHGAAGVRITTLDSEAWQLGFGFRGSEHAYSSGFEENIAAASKLLKERAPDVMDWFRSIRHVIVDEAQDLVGSRQELIFDILETLPREAGATIFLDPAQAIYGFSSDFDEDDNHPTSTTPFHERLLDEFPDTFVRHKLTELFRTTSKTLRAVFEDGRTYVFGRGDPKERIRELQELVRRSGPGALNVDKRTDLKDNELVLFRRRSEVLMASSFLSGAGVSHRLRLSHVDLGIQPWVGLLFATNEVSRQMQREAFFNRWAAIEKCPSMLGLMPEHIWALLHRTAGLPNGSIDVVALRRVLSRARPPAEFCQDELGSAGPVLGTIHASKGREADRVTMMLPKLGSAAENLDEEVRVTYVGATRARRELLVGQGYAARRLHGLGGVGGRLHGTDGPTSAQVEIGRPGDVVAWSPVDNSARALGCQPSALQKYLREFDGQPVALQANQFPDTGFAYVVTTCATPSMYVCQLEDNNVNADLFAVCRSLPNGGGLKPPPSFRQFYLVGSRTVAVSPDDPQIGKIAEPWATRGFFLAPIVKGLAHITMYRRRGHADFM